MARAENLPLASFAGEINSFVVLSVFSNTMLSSCICSMCHLFLKSPSTTLIYANSIIKKQIPVCLHGYTSLITEVDAAIGMCQSLERIDETWWFQGGSN